MNDLRAWLIERLPLSRFVPLAVFLALLGGPAEFDRLPLIGLALVLIATFRIRDDVADRRRDAIEHPERTRVLGRCIRPFVFALAGGLVLGLVGLGLAFGLARALSLLGLAGAFELGYRLELPGRHRWVLLKYPAFALLLADALAPTLAGLCYLSFAIYERLDDETLRARPDAEWRLSAYLFAAVLLAAAHFYLAATSLGWLVVFGGLWAFAVEAARWRAPGARFGLFFICMLLWCHDCAVGWR